jgi:hypothetical protein
VQILTNRLVALPGPEIPLPWYHRAPLGLLSETPVHVALQMPRRRPLGDLVVSLVDPVNWPLVSEVSAWRGPDAPGVQADVYKLAPPLNIVFAEAVTVDSGSRHEARLILEPYHPQEDDKVAATVRTRVKRIKSALSGMEFVDVRANRIHPAHAELAWLNVGYIELGWVHVAGWQEAVQAQAEADDESDQYDLTMAVVSADTDRRVLRYVFPRKGAVSVSVEHTDEPGAMVKITGALGRAQLNILSSLLRRGSAPAQKAEAVLVVEPTDQCHDSDEMEKRVRGALNGFPPSLRVDVKVSGPVDPSKVLYPRRPQEIAVRPPSELEGAILAARKSVPDDKRPIFISRRFVNDPSEAYNHDVVQELRKVLSAHGFWAIEALPEPGADTVAPEQVKARMWASDAAILLVVSTPDTRVFSENLAHEFGFMQGQGKRLLPLVEEGVLKALTAHANFQGLMARTFSKANAMNEHRLDSISKSVGPWLEWLLTQLPR